MLNAQNKNKRRGGNGKGIQRDTEEVVARAGYAYFNPTGR